ncbi:RNA pseudouridine synthase [Helicobacter enhydrae]|uniref:RNA pseudouridylate synthase n=1 Tax=Helicobacter enhydrae TaxID=222136 RepID=A0A1B1U6I2_9HELI|nr:RluA family pseudouridine synthase [Helicobacter enhydrae]ANV98404.1 RNA pseudouridine synthase [Helicobacter enhydrae]
MQKAYKLLAIQENISNKEAKNLIDKGLVSVNGKKLNIARQEINPKSIFTIQTIQKPQIIFEDEHILALEKPPFIESYELCNFFPGWTLLHRLDLQTSGVILLVKDKSPFHLEAKQAFKEERVVKQYYAIINGILSEEVEITKPILTIKGNFARSKISKDGLRAYTKATPLQISGKKTLLEVQITTGRTHQIRVHLQSIKHPIFGDTFYGGSSAKRLMLHSHTIKLLGYELHSPMPKIFKDLMQ